MIYMGEDLHARRRAATTRPLAATPDPTGRGQLLPPAPPARSLLGCPAPLVRVAASVRRGGRRGPPSLDHCSSRQSSRLPAIHPGPASAQARPPAPTRAGRYRCGRQPSSPTTRGVAAPHRTRERPTRARLEGAIQPCPTTGSGPLSSARLDRALKAPERATAPGVPLPGAVSCRLSPRESHPAMCTVPPCPDTGQPCRLPDRRRAGQVKMLSPRWRAAPLGQGPAVPGGSLSSFPEPLSTVS